MILPLLPSALKKGQSRLCFCWFLMLVVFPAITDTAVGNDSRPDGQIWQQYHLFLTSAEISEEPSDGIAERIVAYRHALRKGQYAEAEDRLQKLVEKLDWATEPLMINETLEFYLALNDQKAWLQYLISIQNHADLSLFGDRLKQILLERTQIGADSALLIECLTGLMDALVQWQTEPALLQLYLSALATDDSRRSAIIQKLWAYSDIKTFPESFSTSLETTQSHPLHHLDTISRHFKTQLGLGHYQYIIDNVPFYLKKIKEKTDQFIELRQIYFQALIRSRQYTRLIQLLDNTATRIEYGLSRFETLTLKLRLWVRKGNPDAALATLQQIEREFPAENRLEIYFQVGDLLFQKRRFTQSRLYFQAALSCYPSRQVMASIQWKLFRIHHLLNERNELQRIVDWAERHSFIDDETAAKFCYWGYKTGATSQRDPISCFQRYPLTYYGYRSLLPGDSVSNLDHALFNQVSSLESRALTATERSFLKTVSLLYQEGESEVTDSLVRRYLNRYPDPIFFLHLSGILRQAHRYYLLQLLAESHFRPLLDAKGWEAGILLPAFFPTGYQQQVTKHVATHPIPEPLVFAVIREESNFRPEVSSDAGAVGLMQIMPETAKDIGQTIRLKVDPLQLTDPELNVRLGVTYLSRLLRRYDGNLYLALAAYNGGPSNVRKWLQKNGINDIDHFVESISFDETRGYVKRVMRSYFIYQKIYGLPI